MRLQLGQDQKPELRKDATGVSVVATRHQHCCPLFADYKHTYTHKHWKGAVNSLVCALYPPVYVVVLGFVS